jgi:hypothetical protein
MHHRFGRRGALLDRSCLRDCGSLPGQPFVDRGADALLRESLAIEPKLRAADTAGEIYLLHFQGQ